MDNTTTNNKEDIMTDRHENANNEQTPNDTATQQADA